MNPIGRVTQYIILSEDALSTVAETNISKGFTINPGATYQQVDSASRSLIGLTTQTYQDTNLITTISVTEILSEG